MPFLPYYVQDLGVTDPEQVAIWSGVVSAGHGIAMAIFSPIWGSLADRYGRKVMVERAMFGGALIICAMGFVDNVQQLAILRTIQGGLTGTIPAATTLVASSAPREKSGYALGLLQMAIYMRFTRSGMLEVLRKDYIRSARAKGLQEQVVLTRHALRNALIPVLTILGFSIRSMIGGAVLVETVFAWPGVGRLIFMAINQRDFPLIQAAVFLIAIIFVVTNLLVDFSYAYLDPRIRLTES